MTEVKNRLYLALYTRDGAQQQSKDETRYHWALLDVPSLGNQATRFHARDYFTAVDQTHWIYEEIHVSAHYTPKLLTQTYIGDIVNSERLLEVLRDVPVEQWEGWNCVSWVERALQLISEADDEVLEGGRADGIKELKREALRATDAEVARKAAMVRAML